jgi:aspartyl-tRNA(Asn)/glutamyl-tRNA(Gln) amidotransferase subunit A
MITRPIAELVADVKAGKISVVDLVQESLEAIKANESYHAILEINDAALDEAKALDVRIAAGDVNGDLLGIPYIAKDNFLTVGTHTTASSKILEPFKACYESTATHKLKCAGAILVAKANMDSFGHGSSTENSDFGPTKNPHDQTKVPGGSSGGSAAAVALGLASFALGTDTGGSIRQPASFCGVVGIKPTYGLVGRYGVVSMISSTDVIGPLARSVQDAALVLDVIAGKDANDSTTIERSVDSYTSIAKKPLRIGVVSEYLDDGIEPEVREQVMTSIGKLEAAGNIVENVSLPSLKLALAAYYIIMPAEVSSNLSRYDGVRFGHYAKHAKTLSESYLRTRDEGFNAEAKRRILIGTYMLSSGYYDAYYKQAQKVRTKLINEFDKTFEQYDVLVGPVAPTLPFDLGKNQQDPIAMYLSDIMTVAPSLAGLPVVSMPAGWAGALPVGIQLIGPQGAEATVLNAAQQLSEAAL